MSGPAATLSKIENELPIWGGAIALNSAGQGATAPEWIQLMPKGAVLTGRDGRSWKNTDPAKVIAAFNAHGAPIAIDYEHAQDHLAPKGIEAPAAAWIEELQLRDGATWGRVEWTAKAKASVEAKEYRFFSPAFTFDRATGEVGALIGGALVNRPNFVMAALNRQENPMLKDIAAALGLAETATAGECVMGIAALKAERMTALNSVAVPDITKFVPRAEYETALNRATTAEGKLSTIETTGKEAAVTAAVEAAMAAGKIAPSAKDYYLATCRQDGGLDRFKDFVATQPSLFKDAGLDARDPNAGATTIALNAEQKKVCKAMGLAEADFIEHLAKQAASQA